MVIQVKYCAAYVQKEACQPGQSGNTCTAWILNGQSNVKDKKTKKSFILPLLSCSPQKTKHEKDTWEGVKYI